VCFVPVEGYRCWEPKTRLMGLPGRERSLTISSAVWIQYTNVTDRQMDRHTGRQHRPRLRIASRGKNESEHSGDVVTRRRRSSTSPSQITGYGLSHLLPDFCRPLPPVYEYNTSAARRPWPSLPPHTFYVDLESSVDRRTIRTYTGYVELLRCTKSRVPAGLNNIVVQLFADNLSANN